MTILSYLETYSAVVEHGSFTAAAQALGISKPVVSKQVSRLEQHLGVQLLQRTTRRLHLTQAGEIFADHARRIITEMQEAEQSVSRLQKDPRGRLRISAPESLAMSLLPDVLPRFQQLYPKLELDIRITGRFVDLVEEGIDVALRVGALEDSTLIARKLMPCSFHLCASAEYLNRSGRPEHPDDLAGHNCLIYSRGHNPETWLFRDSQGQRLIKKIKGNLHSDTGSLLMNAALNHAGIFMAPSFMVSSALEEGRLETVLDGFMPTETGLYAVYPYSKLVSKKIRVFVDYLVDEWGK